MFQSEQISILILTVLLSTLFYIVGTKLKKLDYKETPQGIALLAVMYDEKFSDLTIQNMGEKHGKRMSAYIGSIFLYLFISNISGLFGLPAPTSNYSVTFMMALITFIMIHHAKISANGFKGYIKGYFEPFAPFVIPNIFGAISPLISLSLRMFGNILSGTVIMTLVYSFGAWLSSFVPVIGKFNFMGVILAPALHLYFDLFSGFLQAFLFISLSTIMIGVEYSD
ncbi:MAG TPA: F0F1 ATP synthase subunit A [Erysipelothrix sp.]